MKKTTILTLFFVSLLMFLSQLVFAADIWTIGTTDNSYGEFFAAKDYDAVAKKFPGDISVTHFDVKDFPWILPGTIDSWAGSKSHTINIPFDLPTDLPEDTACVLEIIGIGSGGNAPLLEIELNGKKQNIQTERGKTGDQILKTTEGAEWKTYRAFFLFNVLKKTDNTLSIKNAAGSWIVFDSLKFRTDDGGVQSFTVTPLRGVFRGANDQPLRRIRLNIEGFPTQPVTFSLQNSSNEVKPFDVTMKPSTNSLEVDIPVKPELLAKELSFAVVLKTEKTKQFTQQFTLSPERKWEVYLVHQTHLDIGYTHLQTKILKKQVQSIRDALKYIDETKDYPEEAKFKFHPEGMWAVEQFLKEATPEEKAAFVKAAKNRDLHIDGMYAQAMTGMYNEEELVELFSSSVRFCKENGIVLDSVMQTDVPGYTWGLVTAMSQNGIKYMTAGPNSGHRVGRLFTLGEKPFWWESPNGKEKILCWILSTGYNQWHGKPIGHIVSEKEIFDLLSGKSTFSWGENGREDLKNGRTFLFDDLVMFRYGIEGDNSRPNRVVSDTVKAWNEKYLYPKLVVARNSDVMRLLEKKYGDKLPTLRGDLTGYWEDGSASTAEATSINRRAKEQLIQTETLYAMFGAKNYSKHDFDAAWTNLIMYDEHTWGANNSISEPDSDFAKAQDEYKQNYARNGAEQTKKLFQTSVPRDGTRDVKDTLLINTLTRQRNGVTFIGNDLAQAPKMRAYQTDDGKEIIVQYIPDPDGKTVSMYADLQWGANAPSIPALGTLRLKLSDKQPEEKTGVFRINTETGEFRNSRVHLIIDTQTGAIKSLKLAGSDHNFVKEGDDGNSGLDDYLYIIGRDAGQNRERLKLNTASNTESNTKSNAKLTIVANGTLVASVLIEVPESPSFKSFKRQITLFADNDKVRIVNLIDKKKERQPEGMFFGFPFNIPNGKWYIDSPFALTEIDKDQLPGANRNYYPVQRYCSLANEECGVNWVTVDANMVQFAPILFTEPFGDWSQWREHWENGKPNGTLYSWVCNNHWETNYKADQEGELKFEYWIWAYNKNKFDNGVAQRFARQVHQPVLTLPTNGSTSAAANKSLFTLENEGNVIVTGIRPTRDSKGALLVRLFNPTQQKQTTTLKLSEPYKAIYKSNPMEEKGDVLNGIDLAPFEVLTVRVE